MLYPDYHKVGKATKARGKKVYGQFSKGVTQNFQNQAFLEDEDVVHRNAIHRNGGERDRATMDIAGKEKVRSADHTHCICSTGTDSRGHAVIPYGKEIQRDKDGKVIIPLHLASGIKKVLFPLAKWEGLKNAEDRSQIYYAGGPAGKSSHDLAKRVQFGELKDVQTPEPSESGCCIAAHEGSTSCGRSGRSAASAASSAPSPSAARHQQHFYSRSIGASGVSRRSSTSPRPTRLPSRSRFLVASPRDQDCTSSSGGSSEQRLERGPQRVRRAETAELTEHSIAEHQQYSDYGPSAQSLASSASWTGSLRGKGAASVASRSTASHSSRRTRSCESESSRGSSAWLPMAAGRPTGGFLHEHRFFVDPREEHVGRQHCPHLHTETHIPNAGKSTHELSLSRMLTSFQDQETYVNNSSPTEFSLR